MDKLKSMLLVVLIILSCLIIPYKVGKAEDINHGKKTTLMIVDRGQNWNRYYNVSTGEYVLSTSISQMNYFDGNSWQPINLTFVNIDGELVVDTAPYKLVVSSNRQSYRVYPDRNNNSVWIDFRLPSEYSKVPALEYTNFLRWNGNNSYIELIPTNTQVQFKYVLENINATKTLNMTIIPHNTTIDKNGYLKGFNNCMLRNHVWDKNGKILDFNWKYNSITNVFNLFFNYVGVTYPVTIDPTIDVYVDASTDDARERTDGSVGTSSTSITLTYDSNTGYHYYWAGIRFSSLNIPQGSTINDANLSLYVTDATAYDDPYCKVYCHDVADSWTFSTSANNISSRSTTSNFVWWCEENVGNGYDIIDVTTIVQEMADSYNINDLSFIIHYEDPFGDWDVRFFTYDYGTNIPRLRINYTLPKPQLSNPVPANSSVNQQLQLANLSGFQITVNQSQGHGMNITLEHNASGSWMVFNSTNNVANGTYTFTNTSWVENYSTTYYWRVNVTDNQTGRHNTSIYHFTTKSAPIPELVDNTNPLQGIESNTTFYFNLTYSIADGDKPDVITVNISYGLWYDNHTLTYVEGDNTTGANYSYSRTLPTPGNYSYVFYVDSGNQINTTSGYVIVTTSTIFSLYFPLYVDLGDYIMATGSIHNSSGQPLDNTWVYTQFYDEYNNPVLSKPLRLMCNNGAYWLTITTTIFTPGVYIIKVNFTDPELGTNYTTNHTVYITYAGGPGHHATPLYFTFYNNNTGVGLSYESFKIYVGDSPASLNRIYGDTYYTYTGATVYYRIDDYFDNQIYPRTGDYKTLEVTEVNQFEDVPIDWYSFGVKNMNSSVVKFTLQNGTRAYIQYLFPYEPFYWNVLEGKYNIIKEYYYASNGTYYKTVYDNITIDNDTFYWIMGYNLDDIVVRVDNVNCSVTELQNRSVVILSFYNTNIGLGIPDETLKIYLNNTRFKETIFYITNGTTFNLTVKDYYNFTLYQGNFTVNTPYMFIDLGLTFHSYKFNNMNEEYYMISFLKQNATRWFEKAVCPYETIEFLLPSGNYTLRIYDADYNEIYNATDMVNRSKVYVVSGNTLSEIIAGQSVIRGQLLELRTELSALTTPHIVSVTYNIPYIYSTYDSKGAVLGCIKICPAKVLMATTYNTTYANHTIHPLVPVNGTTNGTIIVMNDRIYFEGSADTEWVNISYANGTVIQNTSYLPVFFDPNGATITVNASRNITIIRETRFQQIQKFYWTKYTDTNYYTATISFDNVLNTTLQEVYLYIEFANDTVPDYSTVRVYDVTNGVWLTSGENFVASASGIHMAVTSIAPLESRLFTINYYGTEAAPERKTAVVTINDYGSMRVHQDKHGRPKNYYYLKAQWVNNDTEYFTGTLYIDFNFETYPYEIAADSIDVFDVENSRWLNDDEFVFTGDAITVVDDAMGEVPPNGVRTFEIYYLYVSEEVPEDQSMTKKVTNWLHDQIILPYINLPIEGIHIAIALLLILGFAPTIAVWGDEEKMKRKRVWIYLSLSFIVLTLIYYLQT